MAEEVLREKLELVAEGNAEGAVKSLAETVGKLIDKLSGSGGAGLEKLLGGAGGAMMSAAAAAGAVAAAWAFFATKAIEAAGATEKLVLQIASFIQRSGSWDAANQRSTLIVAALHEVALRTGEEVESLGATFRSLASITGGTDKQLETMTEQLSVLGKMAGTTSKEILTVFENAALSGTVRGPEAKEMLSRFQMTPEQIRQAYLTGDLLGYLTKKIGDLKAPADALASSWDVLMGAFKTGATQIFSDLGAAFEPLKAGLISMRDTLTNGELRVAIRELAIGLKSIVGAVVDVAKAAADLVPFKEIFTVWGALLKVVATQWVTLAGAAETFITILVGAKDIVVNFFTGGADTMARMKSIFSETSVEVQATAQKTADLVKAIWDPDTGTAGAGGVSTKLPPYVYEKALSENYKNVQDMFRKLTDEVLSVGTGPEWDKSQSKIAVHVDDLQKAFRLLAQQAHDLGRDLPAADVARFTDLLGRLKSNMGAQEWQRLREQAESLKLSIAGLAATTATEFAALDRMKGADEITKLTRALKSANLTPDERSQVGEQIQKAWDNLGANAGASFRAGLQKEADLLYSQAETIAQGTVAAFKKITAALKTEGQVWADFLGGLWTDLTSAFETGFYDVLSGKFDSLKDVLKSLWDSVVKDFSKMLAQMLEKWLLTGEAMGSGQGGVGGVFSALLGGGSSAVYTPQGTGGGPGSTGKSLPMGWSSSQVEGGAAQGGPGTNWGNVAGGVLALAGAGYLIGNAFGTMGQKNTYQPTYQGQDLGQTADFGGPGGGAFAAAAAGVAAVAVLGATAIGSAIATVTTLTAAAAASAVTVYGLVIAAVLLIIAGLMMLFSGPQEGHIYVAVKDAYDKANQSVGGHFVEMIVDSTANFVGRLAMKAAGPESASKFVSAYNDAFKAAYGQAVFDIAAGSKDDLQKDVQNFFDNVLPKMAMQAAFGQVGIGQPLGDRDWAGGAAGLDWNTKNGTMDAAGNFIKKQLFDPNAPIPLLLAGIGFTQDAIGEIATKLSTSTDMKVFKQWLTDLVGVVVDLGELAKKFGQSTQEWSAALRIAQSEQGTAAQFAPDIANLRAAGSMLELTFGDDRVAAAKQLVTDSQTLLTNMGNALAAILQTIDQINATTAATIQSYKDKLLKPSELEAQARTNYATDLAAIVTAANPQEVQTAWQQVMTDLSAVLDVIVARIQAIQALQQSYADFRTLMATNAGAQFATDPSAWLSQNMASIQAVTTTLKTATGDDAIAQAKTLLGLVQDRYNNELAMLQKVNSAIDSIKGSFDTSIQNLQMQAMGSVTKDAQGNKVWTPDIHAQGDFLNAQVQTLMGQLGTATTPEQVTAITNQIQNLISQLAAQPQDPTKYAESRAILIKLSQDAEKASLAALGKMHDQLTADVKGIGDLLKAGEAALSGALTAAQHDFTTQLGLMSAASAATTLKLTGFGDALTSSMQDLTKAIDHWIWIMTHPEGTPDPNWVDPNAPKGPHKTASPPDSGGGLWIEDPDDPSLLINTETGRTKPKPPGWKPVGGQPGPVKHSTYGTSAMPEFSITVNVNSGAPEEVASAAAAAIYPAVLTTMKQNNAELVRALRNNPSLLDR